MGNSTNVPICLQGVHLCLLNRVSKSLLHPWFIVPVTLLGSEISRTTDEEVLRVLLRRVSEVTRYGVGGVIFTMSEPDLFEISEKLRL